MSTRARFDVVVPTVGRSSLGPLVDRLAAARPAAEHIIVADDSRQGDVQVRPALPVAVVRSRGRGPAAARNAGWRAGSSEWVAFVDDDVIVPEDWTVRLAADLCAVGPDVAAVQGRIVVPAPAGRPRTDWERNVAGLESAPWATADIAYRRRALEALGGFDERFRRAYREDSDLAVRARRAGWRLVRGRRDVTHPVPRASRWVSLRKQSGNADDALMDRLHGRAWRTVAGAPRGRRRAHLAITLTGALTGAAALGRRWRLARAGAAVWSAGTAELAWRRIAPGPRSAAEVALMAVTSAAIPPTATAWWIGGLARAAGRPAPERTAPRMPAAVLLDRDGTLVVNVPYNGDPDRVRPMPGAREAVERLRSAGVPTAVVSNQSGIGRGIVTAAQVEAVNRRIEELLGPVGPWALCPHRPEERCGCRKPQPGLLREAARALGVDPARCAVVGDIGADVEAARAVGARAVLVPTNETLRSEVEAAPEVARDLPEAVDRLMGDAR